jgi:hypothetical protein
VSAFPGRLLLHVTDEEWELIAPHIPALPPRADGRGRPWSPARPCFEALLWLLRSGARWADLPDDYPPRSSVHRRFQLWVAQGLFDALARDRAYALTMLGEIDLAEWFIDGSFIVAKLGGAAIGPTKRGKGTKLMALADGKSGLPVSVTIASASPGEVTLVQQTLAARLVEALPAHLGGDKAYDSDGLDAALAEQGITMIAHNRRNRGQCQGRAGLSAKRRLTMSPVHRSSCSLVIGAVSSSPRLASLLPGAPGRCPSSPARRFSLSR